MKTGSWRELWREIRRYGLNSMFLRNALRIFLLIMLPMLMVFFWIFHYGSTIIDENTQTANMRALNKAQAMMDMIFTKGISIGENMYSSSEVGMLLNRAQSEYPNYDNIEMRRNTVSYIAINDTQYMEEVYLYSWVNNHILTTRAAGTPERFAQTGWIDTFYEREGGRNVPFFALDITGDEGQLYYFRPLRKGEHERPSFVAIAFNMDGFDALLMDAYGEGQDILIIDENGQILYSTQKAYVARAIDAIWAGFEGDAGAKDARQVQTDAQGDTYIVNVVPSDVTRLRYISAVSDNEFAAGLASFRTAVITMVILCLVMAFICTVLFSLETFKPVSLIREMLNDPMHIATDKMRDNELKHILGTIYNDHGTRTKKNDEIAAQMEALNTARINALQAQINPHFLYNTLQAISFVFVKESGQEDAESVELLSELSDLIRETTKITASLVSLHEEMTYIQKYLTLLKVRFGESMSYSFDIAPDALECNVPKMSLQPVVENIFKHGKAFQAGIGTIHIRARARDGFLYVDVLDNGGGIPHEKIEELNALLARDIVFTDAHIGLMNVNARLRLIFGSAASLRLCAVEDGLCVTMKVPVEPYI